MKSSELSNTTPAPKFVKEWQKKLLEVPVADDDFIFDLTSKRFDVEILKGAFHSGKMESILNAMKNDVILPINNADTDELLNTKINWETLQKFAPNKYLIDKDKLQNANLEQFLNLHPELLNDEHAADYLNLSQRERKQFSLLQKECADLKKAQIIVFDDLINMKGSSSYWQYLLNTISVVFPAATTVQYLPTSDNPSIQSILQKYNVLISNVIFASTTVLSRYFVKRAQKINSNIKGTRINYEDLDNYLRTMCSLAMFENCEIGGELKEINKIFINSWHTALKKAGNIDIESVSHHAITDVSINMLKALLSFYISAKKTKLSDILKSELIKLGKIDEQHDEITDSLINENLTLSELRNIAYNVPIITFGSSFLKKITSEFSNLINAHSKSIDSYLNILFHLRYNHLKFQNIPLFTDFLSKISKVSRIEFDSQNTLHSKGSYPGAIADKYAQESINDNIIGTLSGRSQLQNEFPKFNAFYNLSGLDSIHEVKKTSELQALLKHVGKQISDKVGLGGSILVMEFLSFTSGILGGLPLFSYMYDRTDIFGSAYYYVAPIALVGVYACETLREIINKKVTDYRDEYKIFHKKIIELTDANIINFTSFEDGIILEKNCYGNKNFKKCMYFIAQTLTEIGNVGRINISFQNFSQKEQLYITMRLFNAFTDFILKNDSTLDLSKISTEKADILSKNLASLIVSKSSRNILASLANASPARCHLAEDISSYKIIDTIVASLNLRERQSRETKKKSSISQTLKSNTALTGRQLGDPQLAL